MELQDWRKEPRKKYSNEFKLRMVELASQSGACVARLLEKMASMIMLFSNGSDFGKTKGVYRGVFR
ncbi:IS66 transposase [Escherichia coli]|nr:IS66 transposase [Escherichia coli]